MKKVKKVVSDPADDWIMPLGFGGIMLISVGVFLAYVVARDESGNESVALFIVGNLMILMTLIIGFVYVRGAPEVMVNEREVVLRRFFWTRKIPKKHIELIHDDQKSYFRFLIYWSYTESTIIELKTGEKIIMYDFLYDGFGRVKKALKALVNEEWVIDSPKQKIKAVNRHEILLEKFSSLKGRIISFNIAFLIGMNLFMISKSFIDKVDLTIDRVFILIALNAFFFWLFGSWSFYVSYSDDFLLIKNRLWFWYRKYYRVKDIDKIIHQSGIHREPASIMFKLKNGITTSRFPMDTYRNRDWERLYSIIDELGIPRRD
ncbi:MAG: hypothetical protein RLN88_13725 [Ekhidna sp.]|uniref:hypothetical protein n=1 Tax=Ekhidna sp. TaxID=2608089 RepID=UPI0032EAB580